MNIIVKQNRDGIDKFIKTFKGLETPDIYELLRSEQYDFFIKNAGENFLKPETRDWYDIFSSAYKTFMYKKKIPTEDFFEGLIYKSIQNGLYDLDELSKATNNIINILKDKKFIHKSLKFLPKIDEEIVIDVRYLVFAQNAVQEGDVIFIDVPFFSQLNEEELNDIMAHEAHHFLKKYIKTYYYGNSRYPRTNHFIKTLENEGVANLCNYTSLDRMYHMLGIFEGRSVIEELQKVDEYLIKFFSSLINNIGEKKDSNYQEFLYDFSYIPMSYFMADKIQKILGVNVLINKVGNPYLFIETFLKIYDFNIEDNNKFKDNIFKSLKELQHYQQEK